MNLILLAIAMVCFLFAGFKDGIHYTPEDLIAFGLAAFAAAHISPVVIMRVRGQNGRA